MAVRAFVRFIGSAQERFATTQYEGQVVSHVSIAALSVTWVYLVPITTAAAAAAAAASTTNDSAIMGMILLCYRAREVRNGTGTAIAMMQLLLLLLLLL